MVVLPLNFNKCGFPMKFCVNQAWHRNEGWGSKLEALAMKLKNLKVALRSWNKQVFDRTESHIAKLEERIRDLEESLQSSYSEDVELYLWTPKWSFQFDDRIRRIGIPIVSCCDCCSLYRKYNDMDHI